MLPKYKNKFYHNKLLVDNKSIFTLGCKFNKKINQIQKIKKINFKNNILTSKKQEMHIFYFIKEI